jgi:penicillin-binding protein 1A
VQWPEAEGAFVALDPASGRVRALVGGFDFATSASSTTSPGLAAAGVELQALPVFGRLRAGVMPETVVDDLPLTPAEGASDDWNPKNSDGQFDGPMTVRDAMVRSKNLVSIRLLRQIGLPAAKAWIGTLRLRRRPSTPTT